MTERRTFAPDGQRSGDRWLSRAGKIVVIATAVATGFAFVNGVLNKVEANVAVNSVQSAQIDSLKSDVRELKGGVSATAYMSCVNFSKTHTPDEVPTFCNGATRANQR